MRKDSDFLGEVELEDSVYYGANPTSDEKFRRFGR